MTSLEGGRSTAKWQCRAGASFYLAGGDYGGKEEEKGLQDESCACKPAQKWRLHVVFDGGMGSEFAV